MFATPEETEMATETPYQLIERLLAFRDSGKLTREERDLIADACNMVSRQTDALSHAGSYIRLWTDDRECKLLPTPESLAEAATRVEIGLSKAFTARAA
jgi:hypothetical protein